MTSDLCWVDGRILPASEPVVCVDDSAFFEGRGCYSTGRWTGVGIRFEARHLARLARDAATLGIGEIDGDAAARAYAELGRAAFGEAPGVLRLQASRDASGRVHLIGIARPLGPEATHLRAITLPFSHDGATPYGGAKVSNRLVHTLGSDRVQAEGMDEGLLCDAAGFLVEGTRTNLVTVGSDGVPCVPPAARGAVAGVALEIVRESISDLEARDCGRDELRGLHELVALNAVRGAVAVVELDGRAVGNGRPGPVAAKLAAALDAAR